jgi:putative ABC transport system ATP-binding protein
MSTDSSSPIVEMAGVTKVFRTGDVETKALRGLDLVVERGEFTAIWGPSGSGKSTALNLIGALDTPTTGTVKVEGRRLDGMSRRELSAMRRDRIGFVFQAYNLIPVLTAYENAESVMALQGTSAAERQERVMQLLQDVGLQGMEHRLPHEMSGGQQQRVAIARAIASNPAVVLADEPTANVDSETAEKLLTIMAKLNADRGVTFLFSTHDPRVMKYARRLVGLVDGRVDSDRTKDPGTE